MTSCVAVSCDSRLPGTLTGKFNTPHKNHSCGQEGEQLTGDVMRDYTKEDGEKTF